MINTVAYYVQSPYYTMVGGQQAYLYIDENHKWTLDPTRIKFFDSMKRAKEVADISKRICEIKCTDVEIEEG